MSDVSKKTVVDNTLPSPQPKHKSTTLWITIIALLMNPLAWLFDWFYKQHFLNLIIQNKLENINNIMSILNSNVPLSIIATSALSIATLYVAGQKGKAITRNLSLPPGQGVTEGESDDAEYMPSSSPPPPPPQQYSNSAPNTSTNNQSFGA